LIASFMLIIGLSFQNCGDVGFSELSSNSTLSDDDRIEQIAIAPIEPVVVIEPVESEDKLCFPSGEGSSARPYIVDDCECLQNIGTYEPKFRSAAYALSNDIDCSASISWDNGKGFLPINDFTGSFNGNNKTIRNLTINRPAGHLALFGTSFNGELINTRILDASVTAGSKYEKAAGARTIAWSGFGHYASIAIATVIADSSVINNVHVSGEIHVAAREDWKTQDYVGGVIARLGNGENIQRYNSFTLSNITSNVNIFSNNPTSIGGIIGTYNSSIKGSLDKIIMNNCKSLGSINVV